MTAPRVQLGRDFGNMSYGYLWYRPNGKSTVFAAVGDGGNLIYADDAEKVSVGVTGTFKPRIFDRIEFVRNRIIPLVTGKESSGRPE